MLQTIILKKKNDKVNNDNMTGFSLFNEILRKQHILAEKIIIQNCGFYKELQNNFNTCIT